MYGSERTSRSGSANLGGLTQALGAWPCLHSLPHTISEDGAPAHASSHEPARPCGAAGRGSGRGEREPRVATVDARGCVHAARCRVQGGDAGGAGVAGACAARGPRHCWAWYVGTYTGIIHGRHLSLFSLGWRAGRSGGSRLAVAITISHSKPKEATCGTVPLN